MHLLVDIGNTSIGVVFCNKDTFVDKFSIACEKGKTVDEYYSIFHHLFKKHLSDDIRHICISSVVPILSNVLCEALLRIYNNAQIITVGPGVKTGVLFKIDNLAELGADLVCDAVALKKKYLKSVVAVDLGTATKFLLLNKDGNFEGCSIAPGLAQAVKSLCNEASLLPEVDISLPKKIVGKNTFESIKSGSIFGHAMMIVGMCNAYERECGYKLKRVITGGYSKPIQQIFIDNGFILDENLVFDGLQVIYEKNR